MVNQCLECRTRNQKVPDSMPNANEYTGTYVLVKSVLKVPTTQAYDVNEGLVGYELRCRHRHLTLVLNYEASLTVMKLFIRWLEKGNRKCQTNYIESP